MADTCTAFSVVPPDFESERDDTPCFDEIRHVVITKCDCHPNLFLCDSHFSRFLDRGWITEPWMGVVDDTPEAVAGAEAEIRNSPGTTETGSVT